jgi:hypothetical protein
MPGKHSKKRDVAGPDEPTVASAPPPRSSEVSASELRVQMAILAEQVRHLGDRVGHPGDSPAATLTTPREAPSPAPAHVVSVPQPRPRPPAPAQAAVHQPDGPVAHADDPLAERFARLRASVILAAGRAAAEIRASAEREAARIRTGARSDLTAPDDAAPDDGAPGDSAPAPLPPDLAAGALGAPQLAVVSVLERQRRTLAALAAETDRIEQATSSLRAQMRALEEERQRLYEASARRAH